MKLPTETFGDVIVVHTPEELSGDTSQQLEMVLTGLDRVNVVLDISGSETIDSGGLEAICTSQEALRELGGDLKISASSSVNRKILEITRIDQQIEVFEAVIDAVRSFV